LKAFRAVLRDRRRSQQGSVLSAVLIMTAFLAIISAALVTELSTNLLVSRVLVDRVTDEATVSSTVEVTIDQLQGTPVGQACPVPPLPLLNGEARSAAYVKCVATSDAPSPTPIAGTSRFTVDGTHVTGLVFPWNAVDEYLFTDSSTLYEVNFGLSSPNYSFALGGTSTGPPAAIRDLSAGAPNLLDLIPMSGGCGGPADCVAVLSEDPGQPPVPQCVMPAGAPVTARPAPGVRNPSVVFFGDAQGHLYAFTPGSAGDPDCNLLRQRAVPGGQPIVAGPFVFQGPGSTDEVYVVASDGSSSELDRYTYQSFSGLTWRSSLLLPNADVVGVAADAATIPALLAIDYQAGGVTVTQIGNSFVPIPIASGSVPATLAAAPGWCQCPGLLIGVGGTNGRLYVMDTGLNLQATYAGGASITTAPTADAAGDWFFGGGGGDRFLHEVYQPPGGAAMVQANTYGPLDGAAGTAAVGGQCPNGFCVYVATLGQNAYLTTLDQHTVLMTACITSGSTCLWASFQVGTKGAPTTVHVSGWSYYSP
jgi:hypothetical protein